MSDIFSASSGDAAQRRWCCGLCCGLPCGGGGPCCCGPGSSCHRPSKVSKIFKPLIAHPDLDLSPFQRTWLTQSYLRYVQHIDRVSLDARARFTNIRRSLIVLGVLISGCLLVAETTYVRASPAAVRALFWVSIVVALANNFVTAFLTDLKLAERAILFYRGSAFLQGMGQNFLTRTQRYAAFPSCAAAFRTFVRDVEMAKLLVASEDISLMSSSREQKPGDAISKERQAWPTLMAPLRAEEGRAMYEWGEVSGMGSGLVDGMGSGLVDGKGGGLATGVMRGDGGSSGQGEDDDTGSCSVKEVAVDVRSAIPSSSQDEARGNVPSDENKETRGGVEPPLEKKEHAES